MYSYGDPLSPPFEDITEISFNDYMGKHRGERADRRERAFSHPLKYLPL